MINKVIAILPMRLGSKRVKNKNIRKINNKLLFEYILNTLQQSKHIDEIVINTDIPKYFFKHVKRKNITFINRNKKLRGNCNMNEVIKDTLNQIQGNIFIQTHATNPLLNFKTLDKAIDYFRKNKKKYDSIFSVTRLQKRLWDNNTKPINHKTKDIPTTQNLSKIYEENSCFYIFTRKSFIYNNNRIGKIPKMYEISKIESHDIDEEEDINIADIMTRLK